MFTVPATLFFLFTGAYATFLMFSSDERVVTAVGVLGAFVSFCVGGSLWNAARQAWRDVTPVVLVDARGVHDLRITHGSVAWQDIKEVTLDAMEETILVQFHDDDKRRSTVRRLLEGADRVIRINGLVYDTKEVRNALKAHHRQFQARHVDPHGLTD